MTLPPRGPVETVEAKAQVDPAFDVFRQQSGSSEDEERGEVSGENTSRPVCHPGYISRPSKRAKKPRPTQIRRLSSTTSAETSQGGFKGQPTSHRAAYK